MDVGDGQFEEKQLDGLVRARAAKGLLRPRECAEDERRAGRGSAGGEKLTVGVAPVDFSRLATFFDDPGVILEDASCDFPRCSRLGVVIAWLIDCEALFAAVGGDGGRTRSQKVPKFKRCRVSRQRLVVLMQQPKGILDTV